MVFLMMPHNTSSTKKIDNKIKHRGINIILTCKTKHSHKLTRAYNPCKYTRPNLPKIVVVVHQFVLGVCGIKK
jgi:hypothetical protein